MKKTLLFHLLLFIPAAHLILSGQDENLSRGWKKYLHLDAGVIYPSGIIRENIAIRQNISTFYVSQHGNGFISSDIYGIISGIRLEFYNSEWKTGFSAGLRYTGFRSEITGYTSKNSDYFYLRYSESGGDTKFARVKSLSENNDYILLPLSVSYNPFTIKDISFFVKAGGEISLMNIRSEKSIAFRENSMDIHRDIVLANTGINPDRFYSSVFATAGAKFGREGKPSIGLELFLPSIIITGNNFSLSEVKYYEGFNCFLQIPLSKLEK